MNYHKRCVIKIPNNCSQDVNQRRRSSTFLNVPRSPSQGSTSSLTSTSDDIPVINQISNSLLVIYYFLFSFLFFTRHLFIYKQLINIPFLLLLLKNIPSMVMPKQSRSPSLSGRPVWVERESVTRIKIPHTFVLHSYTRPTVCGYCKKLLRGLFKQGLQCKDCQYNAHKKCIDKIPKDCTGENTRDAQGITNNQQQTKQFIFNIITF